MATMFSRPSVLWFRKDLRVADNPALVHAARHARMVALYIDETAAPDRSPGAATKWWLHESLAELQRTLARLGGSLIIRQGEPETVLEALAREAGASAVYWNEVHEPECAARDKSLGQRLKQRNLEVETFDGGLLFPPAAIAKPDGGPYKVFTAFWKACLRSGLPDRPLRAPDRLPPSPPCPSLDIDDLGLRPVVPWDEGLTEAWTPGTTAGLERLQTFAGQGLADYARLRDRPDLDGTSRLSPYLHFGEISPRQVVAAVVSRTGGGPPGSGPGEVLLRELGWREFAHHLLTHFPETPSLPLDARFNAFPWRNAYDEDLRRWQRGQTGIPLVDAGMRELWHTGWMHNRVRMVVASFLTKNLLIPWQEGADWFWDTLVDADLANNTLGWQWVAGCGADAAPYFRIFNPVLQGEKFDPAGRYVRRWIPELAGVPDRHVHHPWTAP